MQRRTLLAGLALASWKTALAQGAGTARVVVGFAPGGSVDALARLTAEALGAGLGRTVIVENRTGAGGRLAIEQVRAAAPDGDTLLLAPQGPMTLFPHVFRRLRYDPGVDFVPVSRIATGDYALTIGPMVPARDLAGFRAWLKTAGERASFGSPGAGTLPHFLGVSISRALGVPMTHVPYRGSALSMSDLAGGMIACALSPVTEALELHKAGRVHIVATMGAARSPFLPGVPTLKESGIALEMPAWFALYAPAGTPEAVLDRQRTAVRSGLDSRSGRERLERLGLVPAPTGSAELLAIQRRESALWAEVVRSAGFTPED